MMATRPLFVIGLTPISLRSGWAQPPRGRPERDTHRKGRSMRAIIPVAGIGTRLRPHTHTIPKALVPVAGKPIVGHILEELAPLEGFTDLGSADEYWDRSDHANFRRNLGIPVAFLFTDVHEDYHQPTDTPEKIDTDKLRRVVRLVLRLIDELQAP